MAQPPRRGERTAGREVSLSRASCACQAYCGFITGTCDPGETDDSVSCIGVPIVQLESDTAAPVRSTRKRNVELANNIDTEPDAADWTSRASAW
jgi:hypothetical protein